MGRGARRWRCTVTLVAAGLLLGACSSGSPAAKQSETATTYNVGELQTTFTNTRVGATGESAPARSERTLPTTVLFPAEGVATAAVVKNAKPDRARGPYPLIVFAHGLGSGGQEYRELLRRWAASGFVVAAPKFPHTKADAPGGIDAGDYVNQPSDVSAVITGMLRESRSGAGPLAGLIDPDAIGVAGHSLGGITTLGLVADTCCHDNRVKAAIVMSGDSLTFPGGRFDDAHAPPLLFVHGTADALVPYESSVDAFNLARGPKGLVAVIGGDHGSTVVSTGKAFASVVRATTDFFDAYLRNDAAAAQRIPSDAQSGVTRIVFDAENGSRTTVPTTPTTVGRVHHATATPVSGLTDGQTVTVTWSNYTPGKTVNIVECSKRDTTDPSACDLKHGKLLQPDPTGSGTGTIAVVEGAVGTGVCDPTHPDCVIVVNDGGSLDPAASVRVPISFGGP